MQQAAANLKKEKEETFIKHNSIEAFDLVEL